MRFSSYFLPKISNKSRSFLLSHKSFTYYNISLLILIFTFNIFIFKDTFLVGQILGYATNINTNELLNFTNKVRENKGLKPLKVDESLSKAALEKANDMFKNNYWAHISPKGKKPWDFIIAAGYDYFYAGENLAVDFDDSKSVVDAWYNSPSHRENILNTNYTQIGFAVVNGELQGRKTTLIVQMFGSPRNKSQEVFANRSTLSDESIKSDSNLQVSNQPPIVDSPSINNQPISPESVYAPIPENQAPNESLFVNEEKTFISTPVLSSTDVFSASKYISILLGLLLSVLFAIDGYYVRKYQILRISGHTIFHILILLSVIVGIWYSSVGLIL